MKKLFLSLVLSIILPMMARAYDAKIDGIYYFFNYADRTATVTSSSSTGGNSKPYNKTHYSGDVVIPETVVYDDITFRVVAIRELAFCGCFGVTSVSIPNSVTEIGNYSFQGCTGLTAISIPNGVISIGSQAFYDCNGITSVTISSTVISIGSHAFSGTTWYESQPDGMVYIGNIAYKYKGTMPSNATIVLKEGIDAIAGSAFRDCAGLTRISIPKGVVNIGENAFMNCTGLTEVIIPDGVTAIGENAFYGCSDLSSVSIPNSVISVGTGALGSAWLEEQPDGVVYAGRVAYTYKGTMPANTSVVIKDGVVSVSGYAFRNCSELASITMPGSLTHISSYAFSGCDGLQAVHISDLAAWCKITFEGTASQPLEKAQHLLLNGLEIENLQIPEGVTSINPNAFWNCIGIKSVSIPGSVTSIGSGAFSNCTALDSLIISSGVTSIGSSAFFNCANLSDICIPTSVEYLGRGAFNGCSNLVSVIIGNKLKSVEEYTFSGCESLAYISIGSGIKTIKEGAFGTSINLIEVKCYAKDVPQTYNFSSKAFPSSIQNAILYVPTISLEKYKSGGYPWTTFKNIVGLDEEISQKKCATPTIAYVNGKLVFDCTTEDVEFVSEIRDADVKKCFNQEVMLTPTYEITVYATKAGCDDSDVATATIRWRDGRPVFEGFINVTLDEEQVADVNGDGQVGIGDIVSITNIMAGQNN